MVFATFFDTANVRFESTAATFSSLKKTKKALPLQFINKDKYMNLNPLNNKVILFIDFPGCLQELIGLFHFPLNSALGKSALRWFG